MCLQALGNDCFAYDPADRPTTSEMLQRIADLLPRANDLSLATSEALLAIC